MKLVVRNSSGNVLMLFRKFSIYKSGTFNFEDSVGRFVRHKLTRIGMLSMYQPLYVDWNSEGNAFDIVQYYYGENGSYNIVHKYHLDVEFRR